MPSKLRAVLTVDCRHMKNPKLCRSRFDQTLRDNSWKLLQSEKPVVHDNATVSTRMVWSRVFGGRKTESDVKRTAANLLKRAASEAGIDDYAFTLSCDTPKVTTDPAKPARGTTKDVKS